MNKKKVIITVFDSVRRDHIGCYGYGRNTSPNIDALAQSGSVFLGKSVPFPIHPSSREAMYAILSGQTAIYPKNDTCPDMPDFKLLQAITPDPLMGTNHPLFFSLTGWAQGWKYHSFIESNPPIEQKAITIIDWFLKAYAEENPTVSLLWFLETHGPYNAGDMETVFTDDDFITIGDGIPIVNYPFPDTDINEISARYDAAIHYLDALIQPVFELANDDTLVIAVSDHGDWIGEFGHYFGHQWFSFPDITYKIGTDSIRNIFFVTSVPSLYSGDEAWLIDILPTVCHWLGIDTPPQCKGRSLLEE
jgi:hypothetical protein